MRVMRIPDEELSALVKAAFAYADEGMTDPVLGLYSSEPHFDRFTSPDEMGRWLLRATGDWVQSVEVENYGETVWKQYEDESWLFNAEVTMPPTPVHLMMLIAAYVNSMHPLVSFKFDQREWAFQFVILLASETVELIAAADQSKLVIAGN
jgi:hypothetical protein